MTNTKFRTLLWYRTREGRGGDGRGGEERRRGGEGEGEERGKGRERGREGRGRERLPVVLAVCCFQLTGGYTAVH